MRAAAAVLLGLLCTPCLRGQEAEAPRERGLVLTTEGVDRLVLGGHVRARVEVRDPGVPVTGAPTGNLWLLRAGLDLDAEVDEYVGGYLEFHERVGAAGTASFDGLQQAYLRLRKLFGEYGLQAGRFQLGFGSGRMVDPQDWLQAPFTFDGLLVRGRTGPVAWNAFWTQAVLGQGGMSADTNFMGVYGIWDVFKDFEVDTYVLRRRDFNSAVDEWTFGGRAHGEVLDGLQWEAEVAAQSGDRGPLEAGGQGYAVSLAYALDAGHHVGVDWMFATGDNTPTDLKDDTFRPLFMDAHSFNGLADIVLWSNINDTALLYWFEWNDRWSAHTALHFMALPAGVAGVQAGPGGAGILSTGMSRVGFEWDLYIVGEVVPGLVFQAGGAWFLAGNAILNNDDTFWLFGQMGFWF